MYCAQQRHVFQTHPSNTNYQETSPQQPSENDKTVIIDKNQLAKMIVSQGKSNNVNVAAENPLNSPKTSTSYDIDFREIARKAVDNVYAAMEKNAASKKP
jgi:hypothetical protein